MKSAELLSLEDKSWRIVPDMKEARYCFNPCLYGGLIWLCGYGSTNIEALDPETNEYQRPVQAAQLPESHFCCSVEHENSLLVVSYGYLTRFKLEGRNLAKLDERRETVSRTVWQNSNPRALSGNVFFSENNAFYAVNIKDGSLTKFKG